jgi:hypothetical protein
LGDGWRKYMGIRVLILTFVAAVTFAFCPATMAADDPSVGTWKLDPSESKFNSGPPPQSIIMRIEPTGDNGLKITTETIDAQGKRSVSTVNGTLDGKDSQVTGDPNADSASTKRDDANTTETQNKKSGRITSFFRRIVSRDKKKMTVTKTQNDAQGDAVVDIEVFDRI